MTIPLTPVAVQPDPVAQRPAWRDTSRSRPRGVVLLTEFFAVIFLVVAAMLLGTKIFVEILKQTRDLPEAERVMIQQQSLLTELRRDVWNAKSITPIDHGVLLNFADGLPVTWTTDDAGVITRGIDRQWKDLGRVTLQVDGPAVTLRWPTADVRCVSQVMTGGDQ